jgi:hypothetical protein
MQGYDLGYKLCPFVPFLCLFPKTEMLFKNCLTPVYVSFVLPLSLFACIQHIRDRERERENQVITIIIRAKSVKTPKQNPDSTNPDIRRRNIFRFPKESGPTAFYIPFTNTLPTINLIQYIIIVITALKFLKNG